MIILSNEIFIRELNEQFNKGQVIPFIGAGLSMPFGVPDWGTLIRECAIAFGIENKDNGIFKPVLDVNLNKYDYWEAVDIIKKYLLRNEEDIQQYVQKAIKNSIPKDIERIENNYIDLANSAFNIYFTTNYDHIILKYIDSEYISTNLKDLKENLQTLVNATDGKRVFHLHGNISDVSSIVLSKEMYNELYATDVYKKLFSLFSGVKTFLFLGFSFDDIFIREIIKDNKEYFRSKHYIILADPKDETVAFLKREYNIETLTYNPSSTSHAEEIRKILAMICAPNDKDHSSKKGDINDQISLDILPTRDEKRELENNLFCKKLRIEETKESKIDMSKECFFTAEQYFRWLKKSGINASEDIARYMLSLAYMKYKEGIIASYEEEKDTDKFWKYVHEELKKINFNKVKNRINDENMPNDVNKQGFIHVLADETDTEQEVWWGDKRFG